MLEGAAKSIIPVKTLCNQLMNRSCLLYVLVKSTLYLESKSRCLASTTWPNHNLLLQFNLIHRGRSNSIESSFCRRQEDQDEGARTNFLAASRTFSINAAASFCPAAFAALIFCSSKSSKVLSISLLPAQSLLLCTLTEVRVSALFDATKQHPTN